ncbi:uncharacterized protein LOC103514710 [Diaphorina citri]|uniref:Uncharacterized protein LOC103514710 n=1 Tax=Diaphorina citri TaxID=121845 RepID=A0A1S4EI34_DIACI|nr:uncharacterized protein LOC103514710 [Diaphorina citri]
MRREINPCTCKCRTSPISPIVVECEKMTSFGQVVDALQDRFGNDSISLKIAVSNLNDLPRHLLKLRKVIELLGLSWGEDPTIVRTSIIILHEDVFAGLQNVVDLSFSDNILLDVPSHILRRMPYVELIDLSRNRITSLTADDLKVSASILHEDVFAGLQNVVDLSFSDNILLDVPSHILRRMPYVELIDLSRNRITSLTADDLKRRVKDKDFHGLPVLCKADLAHNNIKAINIQLALKTQCQIFGLNSTLRIYLEGNPVLCDDSMRAVIDAMETINNNTKIHGETICQPDSNETSTTTTTTTTTTPEPTPAPTSTTTQRSTTSTTTQTPTTPIQEEYTETITLELPQPVETNNQIPVQDNLEKEKQPDVIRTPDERKRTLDDRVEETRNMPEERLIEEEILNEKVPEDIVSVIDAKIEAEKTPNRIPTAEPVTEIPPRVVNPPIATITKLSPLFSALGPDNVAYVVDNTTDVEFDSISVIKN